MFFAICVKRLAAANPMSPSRTADAYEDGIKLLFCDNLLRAGRRRLKNVTVATRLLKGDRQAQFSARSLRIVVQKTQHFKALARSEFAFDPDMIARPQSSEAIPIGVSHVV